MDMQYITIEAKKDTAGQDYISLESKSKVRATIKPDSDCESPLNESGMRLMSFNHRHVSYKNPSAVMEDEDTVLALKEQRAFMLSAFEHGNIRWALAGAFDNNFRDPANMDRFDTTRVAGIIFVDDLESWPTPEKRREVAAGILEAYSDWCNGECYGYVLESIDLATGEETEIDSCFGYIGDDAVKQAIVESAKHHGVAVDEAFHKYDGDRKLHETDLPAAKGAA